MAPLEGGRQAAPSRTQRGRRPATRPARYSPNCNDGTPSHPSTASPSSGQVDRPVTPTRLPASMRAQSHYRARMADWLTVGVRPQVRGGRGG
jgi:hypothetical protein